MSSPLPDSVIQAQVSFPVGLPSQLPQICGGFEAPATLSVKVERLLRPSALLRF